MRKTLATAAATAALIGSALVGGLAQGAHAYTNGATPVLTAFTCNTDGTVTFVWDKAAGKPVELLLTQVSPTPSRSVTDRVPGSRGSKGSYVYTTDYAQSGALLEGKVRTRTGVTSNAITSTCA